VHPAWIRIVWQNHRMIGPDACNPELTRNVHRRVVQSRWQLEAENLFLRQPLSIALRHAPPRPRLRGSDGALLVWMTQFWPSLLGAVQVVQPEITDTHQNVNLVSSKERACPKCGSPRVIKNGFRIARTRVMQRWACLNCGGTSLGPSENLSKSK
jgi:hypothetical protein